MNCLLNIIYEFSSDTELSMASYDYLLIISFSSFFLSSAAFSSCTFVFFSSLKQYKITKGVTVDIRIKKIIGTVVEFDKFSSLDESESSSAHSKSICIGYME